jgi:hypothetical protein
MGIFYPDQDTSFNRFPRNCIPDEMSVWGDVRMGVLQHPDPGALPGIRAVLEVRVTLDNFRVA